MAKEQAQPQEQVATSDNTQQKTDGRHARKGKPRNYRPTHIVYGTDSNGDLEIFLATKDTEEVLAMMDKMKEAGVEAKRTKVNIKG